jgi:hypothetical protein
VAKVLPPIVINGVRYRVLRLESGSAARSSCCATTMAIFGVYGRNAQVAFSAVPLC